MAGSAPSIPAGKAERGAFVPGFRGILFILAFCACFSTFVSPAVALTLGIFFGLFLCSPFPVETRKATPWLLQGSVVALGFGMNLHEVIKAGSSGFVYTALSIAFATLMGLLFGQILGVCGNSSYLITTGTAICGGSAIAAIGPILRADEEEMAVSLGTVFVLNSVALIVFPPIGHMLGLSQSQFGLWAALAIHDTSSVVGAASRYGAQALVIGTTVKLARALWIVPVSLAAAGIHRSKSKFHFPWFIGLFCLAAVANTYLPGAAIASGSLFELGRLGLTATLFLIGSGISRATLAKVGWRPLAQGIALWILVGLTSLYFIRTGWIAI